MKKRLLAIAACLAFLLYGCGKEIQTAADISEENANNLIVVGFSQVGAESEWRVANTESIKTALSESNGYELIFDDARNEPENQLRAIRNFIQQKVDYIVFSPIVETGWDSILQEAKDAGIPVIVIDRYIETEDDTLYTAHIGSDFRQEGDDAVVWLENLLIEQGRTEEPIRIVDIQGTMESSAQIGRTAAIEQGISSHANWVMVEQVCGDFTKAKAYEVMVEILKETQDITVVYCENDGMALGAIDALEEAGLPCNATDGVIVISFDATKLGLTRCLEGRIALNVECNPLQGPYVDEIIQKLERGESIHREQYIEETLFDYLTVSQELIDSRKY